jgi:CelD/BcsL family acetyltransferase involved in cellulose biosynthesis
MANGTIALPLELPAAEVEERAATAHASVRGAPDGAPLVELVTTVMAMRALERDWRALEDAGAESFSFFQGFDWNMRWVEQFVSAGDRIVIAVGRERGRVVMIWPLMVARLGPIRVLTWLGEPFPQYGGVLLDRTVDRALWLREGWAAIRAVPGVSAIHLRRVRADDPSAAFLAGACRAMGEAQASCFMRLDRHATYDALYAALPSRRRRLRRKLQRKLEARGPLTLRIVFGGDDFVDGLAEALRLKRTWLRDTGQVSKAISDGRLDGLLQSFAGTQAKCAARIAMGVLYCGEDPVAYEIAFHYRGHHYHYLITQAPAFVELSPSKVQIDLTQKWAIEEGMAVFDLLAPEDRYKRDLSDETIAITDFGQSLTPLGRGYIAYQARFRPALKRAYISRVAPLLARLRGRSANAAPPADGEEA